MVGLRHGVILRTSSTVIWELGFQQRARFSRCQRSRLGPRLGRLVLPNQKRCVSRNDRGGRHAGEVQAYIEAERRRMGDVIARTGIVLAD